MDKHLISKSKFISLVLRHKPEEIDLILDDNGWALVDELIEKTNNKGIKIDFDTLKQIVDTNEKKRFAFSEDGLKIRANQGHSIEVDVELREMPPPNILYHGTTERFLTGILKSGLNKMNRVHVHMSDNYDAAVLVGQRHGKPAVLQINAGAMHKEGMLFFISENKVWLTERVSAQYLLLCPSKP